MKLSTEKYQEYELGRERNKKLTARATEEERKVVYSVQEETKMTLMEILLKGAEAIRKEKEALTK